MSHTYASGGFYIHHNSDLSGDVRIVKASLINGPEAEIEIPGEVLLGFVAEYVRLRRISAIEDMSQLEVLGLDPKQR